MLEQLALLGLGWLAGLLSPALIEGIKVRRETTAVVAAIKSELNEVGYRLALGAYSVAEHLGSIDRGVLTWTRDAISSYRGTESTANIAAFIDEWLALEDDQFQVLVEHSKAKGKAALTLPRVSLPYTDARVPGWHHLPLSVRLELVNIHSDVRLINDAVDLSRSYLGLTFTSLSDENMDAVVANIRGAYKQYGDRCRIAANKMTRLYRVI